MARRLTVFSRLVLASILLCGLAASPAQAARVGIAATVNDDVITMSDVDNRLKLYLGGRPQPPAEQLKAMQADVLDRLIDEKLQMQEARALSVDVSDEQIAQGFAEIARQNKTTPEEFRDRVQGAGVNLNTLRDQIRAEIAWSMVVRRKLRPQVNVSEQEIDTALAQRSRTEGKAEYHVAEIFLSTASGADAKKVEQEANEIYAALQKGARFSEIARTRSQSPGANNGGDIGWVTEGQLDPVLDGVLRQMQPGQVNPPVKTADGYYMLFLRDKRTGGIAPAKAADDTAAAGAGADAEPVLSMKQLTIPAAADDPAPVIAAKIARAENMAGEIKSCEALDTVAAEFNTKTAAGPQKLSTLPAPIAAVIKDLPDNALSKPVRTTNGISVFMVCERSAPAAAPVAAPASAMTEGEPAPGTSSEDDMRNQIASEIGSGRLSQLQERYLRDLRATAFIERRI